MRELSLQRLAGEGGTAWRVRRGESQREGGRGRECRRPVTGNKELGDKVSGMQGEPTAGERGYGGADLVPDLGPFLARVRSDDRGSGAKVVTRVEEFSVQRVASREFYEKEPEVAKGWEREIKADLARQRGSEEEKIKADNALLTNHWGAWKAFPSLDHSTP